MEATDVYGLVEDSRVEELQRLLAQQGLTGTKVEVHPAEPGRYQLHDETLHRDAASARRGAAAGIVFGALLGLVVALVLPQLSSTATVLGTIGALAGLGGLVGAMAGLQRVEAMDSDPVTYREVGSQDHIALVEVHDEHWHNRAHRILERHGAVFVETPTPVGPSRR